VNDPSIARRALELAVVQLLRPLCRLLLRHAMSFKAFEDLAKRAYVEVAWKEFGIPGKKPSTSRVAVLSGLTRKEVQRLLDGEPPPAEDDDSADRYNRAARVLTGWVRDADFHDAQGAPRRLAAEGSDGFAGLVRRYSGDMPARAVLDELVRVGAVREAGGGQLELLTRAYVPLRSPADKLAILGSDVADLVTTIEHNLHHGGAAPRFQRKVMYDAIPVSAVAEFRKLSAAQSQAFLEQLDGWLAQHDLDVHPQAGNPQRVRTGLGIYYFEEDLGPYVGEGDKP
jgi:hypothetical protein